MLNIEDNKTTLDEFWDKFAAISIPDGACEAQIDDMKMSFYSGATAFYLCFQKVVDEIDDEEQAMIAISTLVEKAFKTMEEIGKNKFYSVNI